MSFSQKILVPTDFSPASALALDAAALLATQFGAEISLLYVYDPSLLTPFFAVPGAGSIINTVDRTPEFEATARGEQSSERLDLRMQCLSSRLDKLRSTVQVLTFEVGTRLGLPVIEGQPMGRAVASIFDMIPTTLSQFSRFENDPLAIVPELLKSLALQVVQWLTMAPSLVAQVVGQVLATAVWLGDFVTAWLADMMDKDIVLPPLQSVEPATDSWQVNRVFEVLRLQGRGDVQFPDGSLSLASNADYTCFFLPAYLQSKPWKFQWREGGIAVQQAAQLGPHPGQQLARTEGLHEVVVRPRIEQSHLRAVLLAGGDHQQRRAPLAAQALQQFLALAIGQTEVQQHEVRAKPLAHRTRLGRVLRHLDGVSLVGQDFREQGTDAELVVHYKNDRHGWSVRPALGGRRDSRGAIGRSELRK